jgi:ATP-binding cassette subfamily B protein
MTDRWAKYRTLWDAMQGQRLRYVLAIVLMIAGTQFAYLVPLVIRATIDSAIERQPLAAPEFVQRLVESAGGMSLARRNLWLAGAAVVGLTALAGCCIYLRGRFVSIASETTARRLRDRLYDHLQRLPTAYHDKADAGDLIQRCTSDVETIRGFLSGQIIDLGRAVVMIATVVPIMIVLDPWMALLAVAVIPVVVGFSIVFFARVRDAFKQADEAEGALTTQLQENLTGIRVVRAFARQDFEGAKFAERNARLRDLQRRLIRLMSYYWSSTDLMSVAQGGAVIMAGVYWISTGRLTVGTVFAFVAYVNMFLWPIRQMGRTLTDIGKTMVSLGRLDDILSVPREAETASAPSAPDGRPRGAPHAAGEGGMPTPPLRGHVPGLGDSMPSERRAGHATLDGQGSPQDLGTAPFRGGLAVSHLAFSHGGDGHALKDVSFAVEPGQTLAVLGPSGSGKSTLVHLLLRLYDYESGSIRIDGRELRDLARPEARSLFGVVMQEPFLYSKTVRDNIRLGVAQADDEDVKKAAAFACIHDNILEFEKGYDTLVGERGVTLSGGQRQRMALARAILKDPPILILDDALSAVDTETETLILDALRSRHRRRTTLVIAHRLSTLKSADKIIVLEGGRVVQAGTHERLVREDGLYRRLWEIQGSVRETLDQEMRAT